MSQLKGERVANNSEATFKRLSNLVVEMKSALLSAFGVEHDLSITCRYDVFGSIRVIIYDGEEELTDEMTLVEMMDWIEGASWAVRVLTRSS